MAGTHLQFLVLFCFLCIQFTTSAYTPTNSTVGHIKVLCIQREKQALLKLQSTLVDAWHQPISSWRSEEEDCCKWSGILCSNRSGHIYSLHVHEIISSLIMSVKAGEYSNREISSSLLELQHLVDLDLSNIQGLSIPKSIGSFTKLRHLSLSLCNLTGSIPHELGNLSRLVSLDLSYNYFANSESLMWLSHLPALKYLDLSGINLSQAIDWLPAINSLPSLVELRLWRCGLSLKTPPPPLLYSNSCSSLTWIEFYKSSLSSSIFPWLFNFNNSLVHLDLSWNEIHGPIPDAFGSMLSLQYLDLRSNHLEGEIPRAMGNLFRLETLDLSMNGLAGKVPDMKNFSSLSHLDLSNNRLNGSLPESIWLLSNLQTFDISSNFFSGVVSEIHFLKLTKLTTLDFSSSSLSFNLSSNWVPPFQLERLGMASCKLGPGFPQWLFTQHKLYFLDIPNAGISGIISSSFWELPLKLHYLNISNNHISGELSKLPSILVDFPIIDASSNSFHGSIPPLPPATTGLNLSKNKFTGTTSMLCSMASDNLLFLDLSDNFLSGQLPDCWRPYINLAMLNLENNNFSGSIPASFGFLFQLQRLHLRNNSFSGELPSSMVNCVKMKLLDVGENKLSGAIPQWIGDFWLDLIVLRLRSNLFYGTMTLHLCHLASLQILDLSHNNISGSIPQCISDFSVMKKKEGTVQSFIDDLSPVLDPFRIVVLEYTDKVMVWWKGRNQEYGKTLGLVKIIDLSSNNLSGEIPGAITSLHGLVALNLSHNRLIGTIPLQIGQLELLDFLDLSANQLSGRLPDSLRDLHFLGRLNVSYNNLSGKIPLSTQLQSFDNTSFMGNEQLCGKPLPNKCPGEEGDIPSTDEGSKKFTIQEGDDELISRGFYLCMGLGFGTGFWAVSISLLLCRRWRHVFFRFMSHIEDWLYATIVLKIIILQRRL